jgi:regulator of sigma E protease
VSWLLAAAGFAALIVLHELGHFAVAKAVGMRVERFALFFPPYIARIRRGETEYAIGTIPLGGFVRISGMNPHEDLPPEVEDRAYFRQPAWKRIVVIAAGPAVNLVLAFGIFWAVFVFHGVERATTSVGSLSKGSAAAGVLRPGDKLVAVDGVRGDPDRLRAQIGAHRCAGRQVDGCVAATPAKLTVVRDGRELALTARPKYSAGNKRPLLGFSFAFQTEKQGAGEALSLSTRALWNVSKATVSAITGVFYDSQKRKEVSGVVGSYESTRQVIKTSDAVHVAEILALISLSLAIVNLFPFLPLDGGHIFWALAEKLRGRPIAFSVMERASVVGFVLVAFLFVVGLSNDLGRLQGEGFGPR